MSRNGAGIYQLPVYGNPVVNGTVIDPVWANGNFSDMATALTTSVSSDGQTPITGNLMMSGFKHTGAGSATGAGQYLVFGQTQGDLTTTGNTILGDATTDTLNVGAGGLIKDANGNVGIGATPLTSAQKLQVHTATNSNMCIQAGAISTPGLRINAFNDAGTTNIPLELSATQLTFDTVGTERLRIDTSGNVCVGTTTAIFTSAGRGNITINGSSSSILSFGVGGTGLGFLNHDGTNFTMQASSGLLNLSTNNTVRLSVDSVGRFFGSALHNNSTLPTGATNQYIASGTYTPTLTNVANSSALSAAASQWMRVGNVVTVSGAVTTTFGAATSASIDISLPIPSAFTGTSQAGGAVVMEQVGNAQVPGYVFAATATGNARMNLFAASAWSGVTWHFSFTYVIV